MTSSPSPPHSQSLPASPVISSIPAPPWIRSLPEPPVIVASTAIEPAMSIRSLPPAPSIEIDVRSASRNVAVSLLNFAVTFVPSELMTMRSLLLVPTIVSTPPTTSMGSP